MRSHSFQLEDQTNIEVEPRKETPRKAPLVEDIKLGEVTESDVDIVPCSQSDDAEISDVNAKNASESDWSASRGKLRRSRRLRNPIETSTPSKLQATPSKKCR